MKQLFSFTGLIPMILVLPLLTFEMWAIATVVGGLSAILVITYHLYKRQGITSLDLLSLGFALLNVILYFGFHTAILFKYLDTAIYTMLLLQVLYAQIQGEPWTIQYAKRSIPSEQWYTSAFRSANQFISLIWGGCFLICLILSLLRGLGAWHILLPAILLIGMAILTPSLSFWYAKRVRSPKHN
jgi:hypothetical protein